MERNPNKPEEFEAGEVGQPTERLMKETVPVREGSKTRRVPTSDALAQVLVRGLLRAEPGAIRVQAYLEDKTGMLSLHEAHDPKKQGLLVVPKKLPRDEWEKRAQESLRRVEKPIDRPASTIEAASRLTSHSQGAGEVSSKSLISKMILRSGVAKPPKFTR
jgi:hypothetical protein